VTFALGPNEAKQVISQDLEDGKSYLGLEGSLGNGTGKSHPRVESSVDLKVQILPDTPAGYSSRIDYQHQSRVLIKRSS
jgi:hypothetical protein